MATDLSAVTARPSVVTITLSGTPDTLTQVIVPDDPNCDVEVYFAASGGYATFSGTDGAVVGAAAKHPATTLVWTFIGRATALRTLLLGSANGSAVVTVKLGKARR